MLISSAIRYRNLFFLAAFFCVLCLSPLADIHLEGSSETKSFTHGQKHNETIFAMFLHEVLFNQLQHTLDNVFPGISYPSVNINKNLVETAKNYATVQSRSVTKQIEHWIKIGHLMEENPDLTYDFIIGLLQGVEDMKTGNVERYNPDDL